MPLTQDPTLVTSTNRSQPFEVGVALTQGMPFYLDAADGNKAKPCDNTNGNTEQAKCKGIALCAASPGQHVLGSTDGSDVFLGVAVALGEDVYVGTAGAIILGSEFVGNEEVTHIGTANADGSIKQKINATGGQHS